MIPDKVERRTDRAEHRRVEVAPNLFDESEKQKIWQNVYQNSGQLIDYLKYQLANNPVEEDTSESQRVTKMEGLLRGRVGEMISGEIPDVSSSIIYGQPLINQEWKTVPILGKEKMLVQGLTNTLKGREIKIGEEVVSIDQSVIKNLPRQPMLGGMYGGFFNDITTMPDGVIKLGKTMVGPVEVKAYTPEEWGEYLKLISEEDRWPKDGSLHPAKKEDDPKDQMNYGWNEQGEQFFIEIVRGNRPVDASRRESYVTLLRIPADAPDKEIMQLADLISEKYHAGYGRLRLVVQKLPFTTDEMNLMAKEMLSRRMAKFVSEDRTGEKVDSDTAHIAELIAGRRYIEGLGMVEKKADRDARIEEVDKKKEKTEEEKLDLIRQAIVAWRAGDRAELLRLQSSLSS